MKALLLTAVAGVLLAAPGIGEQPEVYSADLWEIPGPPTRITWVEIHNRAEAKTTGIAHVSVHSRKKGAPVWELEWICDHIAITTEALKRSVTRPMKSRGAYPERFYEALHRWESDEKPGKGLLCTTSIQEWLKERH